MKLRKKVEKLIAQVAAAKALPKEVRERKELATTIGFAESVINEERHLAKVRRKRGQQYSGRGHRRGRRSEVKSASVPTSLGRVIRRQKPTGRHEYGSESVYTVGGGLPDTDRSRH